ncbi:unnamed protein product [Mytilus edulis]|uniref:Uncharacterized protein n=1 Tax=Mytilus edulis TaxID=6550 RepID=A0A8S3UQ36_MYTED|nr:unnamed protein product [Mytilus edulis]
MALSETRKLMEDSRSIIEGNGDDLSVPLLLNTFISLYVLDNAYRLRNTRYGIKQQFPKEIEDRRRKLYPIMKEAKRNRKIATLVRDRLFIDNELYQIPDDAEIADIPYQDGSLPTRQGGSSPLRQSDTTPQRPSYASPQRQSDATPPRIEQQTSTPSSDSNPKKRSRTGSTPKAH